MKVRSNGVEFESNRPKGSPFFVFFREDIPDQEVFAFINTYWVKDRTHLRGELKAICPDLPLHKVRWKIRIGGKLKEWKNRFNDMHSSD